MHSFTMVGIAGEDDLDRTLPVSQVKARRRQETAAIGEVQWKRCGRNLGTFAKSRKPWTPPKQTLARRQSRKLIEQIK